MIYCDSDGNEIAPAPYHAAGDEVARLRAENAALREIANEMAPFVMTPSENGMRWECSICNESEHMDEPGTITHAPTCPVRRLQEMG